MFRSTKNFKKYFLEKTIETQNSIISEEFRKPQKVQEFQKMSKIFKNFIIFRNTKNFKKYIFFWKKQSNLKIQ